MKLQHRSILTLLILIVIIGRVFIACSGDEPVIEAFDQDAPHLVMVSPEDSTTDVPVNMAILLSFDEAMVPSTIIFGTDETDCSGSLQLSKDDFLNCVPMSQENFSYSEDKKTFNVSPQSPLDGFSTYKIKITTSAKDLALNPLEQEFMMTYGFTTGPGGGGPANNAQHIYFGDQNTKESEITGGLEVVRAEDESNITGYRLYWGSSDSERLTEEPPIDSFLVTDEDIEHYFENVTIPENATHFLVYSVNQSGVSATPLSMDIPDTVLKMVANINKTGSIHANPHSFHVWNSKLYFSADNGVLGAELWEYDGISSPTLAADIWGGVNPSMTPIQKMLEFNSKLYFSACDITNGCELREYDGSSVTLVSDIDSGPTELTLYDGKMYFGACDGTNECELWFWDLTGTYPISPGANLGVVTDIVGSGPSNANIKELTVFNGKMYFSASDQDGLNNVGNEIWWYDGSSYASLNIRASSDSSSPEGITIYNNRLIFGADDGGFGREVWFYDGQTSPTPTWPGNYALVADIHTGSSTDHSDPKGFTVYNSKLYFSATNGTAGEELWVYDGSSTYMVADIEGGATGSMPSGFTEYKGMLLFSAKTSGYGTELYGYDNWGDYSYPFMIADINSGSSDSFPEFFTEFNERLYFAANGGTEGTELWVFYIE